jgi:hypothetical protein
MFLQGVSVPVRPEILDLLGREWLRLAAPGSFWDGHQRVEIAGVARAARRGSSESAESLPAVANSAAAMLGSTPGRATRIWVESVVSTIGPGAYVELVGVVARAVAVDSFHRSLGAPEPRLPDPQGGEPTGEEDLAARSGAAWVPMVGGASIVQALSGHAWAAVFELRANAGSPVHTRLDPTTDGVGGSPHLGLERVLLLSVGAQPDAPCEQ